MVLAGPHLLLIAAEVNVVLRWHLWPRALTGELEPADRRALRRFAEATRRDRREQIAVSFDDDHLASGAETGKDARPFDPT